MKRITAIISALSLIGCEPGSCVTYTRTIANNSGKDVKILSFQTSEPPKFSKEFSLKNQGKFGDSYKVCPPGYPNKEPLYYFFGGDSIVIDFGDKIKGYGTESAGTDIRNPYYLYLQDKSNDFIYTLTPEDYANATPKP